MEFLKIVVLAIGASIAYGIAHDQVTARVCVEYFTIGHPPIGTDDPTLLALGWGVLATWWVGAILGVPLATLSRIGRRPKLAARDLLVPIALLLAVLAGASLDAGVAGFLLARSHGWRLPGFLAVRIPPAKHAAFFADWWAHSAAYLAGFAGGIALCAWAWWRRGRLARRAAAVSEAPARS